MFGVRPTLAAGVLEPLAAPTAGLLALGPVLAALHALPVGRLARRALERGDAAAEPPSLAASAALAAGTALVAVAAVAVPVVLFDVPRAAVALPSAPPNAVVAVMGGGLFGVVVHYATGVAKPFVYAALGEPDGVHCTLLPETAAGWGYALGVALPTAALAEALLACGALAALVAGWGTPPAVAALLVAGTSAAGALAAGRRDPAVVAVLTLVELGVLAAFVATGSLALAVVTHFTYNAYTVSQVRQVHRPHDWRSPEA